MKTRAFRYLWVGQALANGGDVLFIVAIIAAVFATTESAIMMSIIPVVITFSRFISSVIAPLILDRFHLKNLLFYSQVFKTALMGVLSLLLFLDAGHLFVVFLLVSGVAFLDGWALPARNAFVPSIVRREDLIGANGFLSTIDQAVQFSAWAVGGILVAFAGEGWTLVFTAFLFLASSMMMYSLPMNSAGIPVKQERGLNIGAKMTEGWGDIWRNSRLRNIFFIYAIESAATVVWIAAILYVYVDQQLGRGEEWWGFLNGAFFIGLIAAGVLLLKTHRLFSGNVYRWLPLTLVFTSLATLFFGLTSIALLSLLYSVIFGFFDGMKVILLQTAVQQSVSPERLGKVFAAQGAVTTLIFGLFSLGAGFFTEQFGIELVFIVSAVLLILAVIPARALQVKLTER
ncbi:MFS transporter [Bacillus sp. P14.5]|uniref:MFS transporter n=1 Tax=Bacillus sp. P14.5 TaxID=1983400 RepID=UPI0013B04CBF|nr:MFS transporter [Bacillus sp. P14.5]